MSSSSSTPLPLQDRIAIVTGASRGIGKAIAIHLATLGARVVVNYTSDSSQPLADDVVSQINSLPPSTATTTTTTTTTWTRAVCVQADVSDPDQVVSLFDTSEQAFGTQPHIVVCNAAVTNTKYPTIEDTDVCDFDYVFKVNARGTFLCAREAAKRVVRGGGGRIVTVSTSLTGAVVARSGAYTPSKAAVEAMTKVLAKEMKGAGVTVNCVAPGPTGTDMFSERKMEERLKEVAEANPMGRLGSDECSFYLI